LSRCVVLSSDDIDEYNSTDSNINNCSSKKVETIKGNGIELHVTGKIDLSKFERKKVEIKTGVQNYYVIDTNVFVNSPEIISRIDKQYPIILAAKVVDELDKMKIKLDTKGKQNAENAIRSINRQMGQRDIRMELSNVSLLPEDFDKRSPDNMILSVALKYKSGNPILLTSDNGLQLKAKGLGLSTISLKDFIKR
jgi:rRNA-processing protein FCF1